MTWADACCMARARVLALAAMAAAGGKPSGGQLRRAVDPVLGDLLPLPPIGGHGRHAAAGVGCDLVDRSLMAGRYCFYELDEGELSPG